jgi:hypothetical protein
LQPCDIRRGANGRETSRRTRTALDFDCKRAVILGRVGRLGPKRNRATFETWAARFRQQWEVISMAYEDAKADVKKTMREADNKARETWRRADGEESLSDKIANTGDDIRTGLGNAGDDIRAEADKIHEDVDRDHV